MIGDIFCYRRSLIASSVLFAVYGVERVGGVACSESIISVIMIDSRRRDSTIQYVASDFLLRVRAYQFIMAALCNRGTNIFLPCDFYLLSIFYLLFSSPNLSGHRLDVYHTSTHGVALVQI